MPARTGNTYTIPGKGTYNFKKKTYAGKGRAPAGSKKTPELSYKDVPTVTVTSSGAKTSGFASRQAARSALRSQERRSRRVGRILRQARREPQEPAKPKVPKRRELSTKPAPANMGYSDLSTMERYEVKEKALKEEIKQARTAPKPKVTRLEGPTPKIRRQEAIDARAFAKEQGRPAPKIVRAGQARVAKPGAKRIKREYRQTKRMTGRSKAPLRSEIVQTPAQAKLVRKVLRVGERKGANRKEKLAALVTGAQETGWRNLPAGGAVGGGWREELNQYYENPNNVRASANRFFDEAKSDSGGARGKGSSIADFAQQIQASGAGASYYADNEPEARSLLRQYNQGKTSPKVARKLGRIEGEAKEKGIDLRAGAKPSKKTVRRYKAIDFYAKRLEQGEVPYDYGGGHEPGTPKNPSAGLDCSSSTVWVLRKSGVKIPNIVSGEFGNYLPSGPGAVTVFYNDGHVFMRIGDRYYGTSSSNPKSGPGFVEEGYSADYLSQYNVAHVPGLGKKAAIELGIDLKGGGSQSFPGMSFSDGGTTATINGGAGTTKAKPGFSNGPIRLTPTQKANRTFKKLEAVGIGSGESTADPTLAALEKKYGSAVV